MLTMSDSDFDDMDSKSTSTSSKRIAPPATVIKSPPSQSDETDSPDLKYPSNPNLKRGQCLIINQKNFDKQTGQDSRSGTDVDAVRCEQVFRTLSFTVTRKDNLSVTEMKMALKQAADQDHSNEECFVCIIMSHGESDYIYGRDGKVQITELVFPFRGNQCNSLLGKPKIFIFQACRGMKFDKGVVAEAIDSGKSIERIPVEADFLYAYSTTPGYFSWRNNANGSWFLQKLCEVFDEYGTKHEILELLTVVSRRVGLQFESCTNQAFTNNMKQQPSFVSMLTRKFYLAKK